MQDTPPELTNLLPQDRIRGLRREYFFRLATVGVLVLAGLVGVHGVLLVPSYLYLGQQIDERQDRLEALSTSLSGTEEQKASERTATLEAEAAYLVELKDRPTASAAVKALLALPRPGVRLTSFTYAPPAPGGSGRMTVSGIASSRDTLRQYDQALAALPFVASADLPISAYAKEADIDFTITLTGSLAP